MTASGALPGSASRLGPCADVDSAEPTLRHREEQAALLSALMSAMVPPVRLPAPRADAQAEQATAVWRAGDEPLTPAAQSSLTQAADTGVCRGAGAEATRLAAEVETEALGRVCIVVNRTDLGVNVVLGLDNPQGLNAARAERENLVRALEAVGIRVASVDIANVCANGTVLAPSRNAPQVETIEAHEGSEPSGESYPPRMKTRRRLNIVV